MLSSRSQRPSSSGLHVTLPRLSGKLSQKYSMVSDLENRSSCGTRLGTVARRLTAKIECGIRAIGILELETMLQQSGGNNRRLLRMSSVSVRIKTAPDAVLVDFVKGHHSSGLQMPGKLSDCRHGIWLKLQDVADTRTRGLSPDDVLARQPSQFYRSYTQAGLVPTTVIART
jgi:hypothetical protein